MTIFNPYSLGATLYIPAIKNNLLEIISGDKYPLLLSAVMCLEDAIVESEVVQAMANLKKTLIAFSSIKKTTKIQVFIRPRNVEMAIEIIATMPLTHVDGFVLPKFDNDTLFAWDHACKYTDLRWMPTLETAQAHDAIAMSELATQLSKTKSKERILALRIGGNDLLSCLGLRRNAKQTLYEGPLGYTIAMLVSTFGSRQYALTAPVFEGLDDVETLNRELSQDIAHGLVGKTAIHPSQLLPIHNAFRVELSDYQAAIQILNSDKAVYKWNNTMAEPATHKNWARGILFRADTFGVLDLSHDLMINNR